MWFRNLRIFRLESAWPDAQALSEQLQKRPLMRCGSFDLLSKGWVFPRQEGYVHVVNRQWLLAMGAEQKLLPASVIRQVTEERIADIESEQDRKVGRKEKRDLRDAVTQELLPRAFTSRRTTWGWIDPINGWLVVDAGSDRKADEFLEVFLQSVGDIALRPLHTEISPTSAMTAWLAAGEAPSGFTIDDHLELRSAVSGQSAIRYVKHALEGEEIGGHIAGGKLVTRLALTWNDRVSFVLSDNLQLKRLQFQDVLKEEAEQSATEADEQFDIDFALMAGELARMFDDLVAALGGAK